MTTSTGSVTTQQVFDVVRNALAVVLELPVESVTAETDLREAGADSLALVELADVVEAELSPYAAAPLHIPDDDLAALTTVGATVDYLTARL